MLIFIAIAIGSFIIIAGSFLFGHDHDTDHAEVSHDHGEACHDISHDSEPTIGFFSTKVLATLTMGFGAAGAIARVYGADYLISSLCGIGGGGSLGTIMYLALKVIYKQQASSLIDTSATIGSTGTVTTSIAPGATGEIGIDVNGRYVNYLARSATNKAIPKGSTVKVVKIVSSQLIVEEVEK